MGRPWRPAERKNKRVICTSIVLLIYVLGGWLMFQLAAAKTYVITDGQRVVTCTTFATDPAEILSEAGVMLEEQDFFRSEDRGNITVHRARRVRVIHHGQERTVISEGETVADLLNRLGLPPEEGDVLSHSPEEATFDGMILRVDAVTTRRETYTATLAHETKTCTDMTLPAGEETVLIRGQDGELQRTAEVTYRNGVETERKILSETVTIPAVSELVAIGTGEMPAEEPPDQIEIGDGYIRLPDGEVLTYTRTDNIRATGYTHTDAGCDLITSTGTRVRRGTVAVDPRFIPYGTRMFIVSHDGYVYGMAVAEDCGGAIKRDRMDLYFPTYDECIQFGYRRCTIYFLG